MARTRKPPARRQHQGGDPPGIGLVLAAAGPAVVPAADKSWLVATRRQWEVFWTSELSAVADLDTDLPALSRLFGYYDELDRARREVGRNRFVAGSVGQRRVNPAAKYVTELEGLVRQLEDRFGLSPKARLQLGVDFNAYRRSLAAMNAALDPGGEDDPR